MLAQQGLLRPRAAVLDLLTMTCASQLPRPAASGRWHAPESPAGACQAAALTCWLRCAGVGLKHLTGEVKKLMGKILAIDQNHYPEMLGHTCIINAPGLFKLVFGAVKPMLDARTQAKIEVGHPCSAARCLLARTLLICSPGSVGDKRALPSTLRHGCSRQLHAGPSQAVTSLHGLQGQRTGRRPQLHADQPGLCTPAQPTRTSHLPCLPHWVDWRGLAWWSLWGAPAPAPSWSGPLGGRS